MTTQFVTLNTFQLQQQLQQKPQQPSQQSITAGGQQHDIRGRPIIERGASWSYNETRILLSLWGQDMVQRQLTNSKRTRHVWEKIAERIREHGFERSADQVRTRVFNMIAEYRRILKNPTPERKKKCIFFDALHKIYQAKDTKGVKAALNDYEEEYNLDPIEFSALDDTNDANGDASDEVPNGVDEDKSEVFSYAMSPSQALPNGMNLNGQDDSDGFDGMDDECNGPTPAKRLRSDSNLSSQQNYMFQQFDNSSSALLIDRMFAHLAKETEVMREWVHLERERMAQEVIRRKQDNEREERREKAFLQTLNRMQDQMFSFLSKVAASQPHNSSAVSSQSSPCNHLPHDDALEAAGGHDYN